MADEEAEEVRLLNEKGESKSVTRKKIKELVKQVDESYLELGRHLYNVYYGDYWEEWKFESFEDYCQEELGFAERKAKYLFTIWKKLQVDLGIAKRKLEKIGWTKASKIVNIVDEKNVEKWLDRARTMKVKELEKAISKYKGKPGSDEDWHMVNFKLADEQFENLQGALTQAEVESGSDARGHNLDLICTEFRSSRLSPKDKLPNALKSIERAFGTRVISIKNPDLFKEVVGFIKSKKAGKKSSPKAPTKKEPEAEESPANGKKPTKRKVTAKKVTTKKKVKAKKAPTPKNGGESSESPAEAAEAGKPVKKAPRKKRRKVAKKEPVSAGAE